MSPPVANRTQAQRDAQRWILIRALRASRRLRPQRFDE